MQITEANHNLVLAARSAGIDKLAEDWSKLLSVGQAMVQSKIAFVNLGREIGIGLQGLCQHDQIKLSFFETIKSRLPESLTYAAAQKCIHLANNMPLPAVTIEDATRVETQLLLGVGFIELPHRAGDQQRHDSTPYTAISMTLNKAKDGLLRQVEDAPKWDDETRTSILRQVEAFSIQLDLIKAKLI